MPAQSEQINTDDQPQDLLRKLQQVSDLHPHVIKRFLELTAVSQLPEQELRVFELALTEGLNSAQIAEELELDEGTVLRLMNDALRRIRNSIAHQSDESLGAVRRQVKSVGKAVEELSTAAMPYKTISPEITELKTSYEQLSASVMELQDSHTNLVDDVEKLVDDKLETFAVGLPPPDEVWPQRVIQTKFKLLEETVKGLEDKQREREEAHREKQGIVLARWQVWIGAAAFILTFAALILSAALAILQWLGYL